MVTVIGSHLVENVEKWKASFEGDASRRDAVGMKTVGVYSSLEDPNEVTIVFQVQDAAIIEKMMQDPGLQDKMKEAGVIKTLGFKAYSSL